ncbi:MAG TPA: TolC family protein [Isosphaeraceae bacterium]|nr:TolC family protein [Isosphaeraceae bacterium]
MRLTKRGTRLALAAAFCSAVGCQRLPYLDQAKAKAVPHAEPEPRSLEQQDRDVQQANYVERRSLVPLPSVDPPRTPQDPDGKEPWPLTLQDAIRIGLDNSEVVRVISLGAQGIPVGGFEPTPIATAAGGALGQGNLTTVYDPAIQETQIALALAKFDAQLTSSATWGRSEQPFNNAIQAGTFSTAAVKYPVIFDQQTEAFTNQVQKLTGTGGLVTLAHNMNFLGTNSPTNVFQGAWTTATQLQFVQPLLGATQSPNGQVTQYSGLEANRAQIVIARLNADTAVWTFKAAVQEEVRSIEQQYWALAQQHVQLWSRETAVQLGEEVLRREQARLEAGTGAIPSVAAARQQLEQFRLDLVTATSDVITTERQLRNILGLKPTDNRRIIPVTEPTEARLEPNWEVSLSQMISFQPDIVRNTLLVRLNELQLLLARNQLLPALNFQALYQWNGFGHLLDQAESVGTGAAIKAIDPLIQLQQRASGLNGQPGYFHNFQTYQVGFTLQIPLGFRAALANVRQQQLNLLRQRAILQQVVHQTTHALARFFLEVDANYKQFKTAGRLRDAAQQNLEAQQAFYEQGTITIDQYLNALNTWSRAVALEAQYKTSYNISIAALEEAKGTLLAYDNIAVAEGPQPRKAYIQARDQQAGHFQVPFRPNGNLHPLPPASGPVADPVIPQPSPGLRPLDPKIPLPAPLGPLGPAPSPVPPAVPAGEASHLTGQPAADPGVAPASAAAPAPTPAPVVAPDPTPAPAAGPDDDLPTLPPEDLPPLPKE